MRMNICLVGVGVTFFPCGVSADQSYTLKIKNKYHVCPCLQNKVLSVLAGGNPSSEDKIKLT